MISAANFCKKMKLEMFTVAMVIASSFRYLRNYKKKKFNEEITAKTTK